MDIATFARRLVELQELKTNTDRAVAILWAVGVDAPDTGLPAREIARVLEGAGYPGQNVSRLSTRLEDDSRTAKAKPEGFRLKPKARIELAPLLGPLAGKVASGTSESLLPRSLLEPSRRTYLIKVADQINGSFAGELFDCTAVMMRRLAESLIIEVFEALQRESVIKDSNGHFYMLGDLISAIESENGLNLGRSTLRGLKQLKDLGDKSAHNRRFNAQRADIEHLRADFRSGVEDLLHLAKLIPVSPVAA